MRWSRVFGVHILAAGVPVAALYIQFATAAACVVSRRHLLGTSRLQAQVSFDDPLTIRYKISATIAIFSMPSSDAMSTPH